MTSTTTPDRVIVRVSSNIIVVYSRHAASSRVVVCTYMWSKVGSHGGYMLVIDLHPLDRYNAELAPHVAKYANRKGLQEALKRIFGSEVKW